MLFWFLDIKRCFLPQSCALAKNRGSRSGGVSVGSDFQGRGRANTLLALGNFKSSLLKASLYSP